MAIPAEALRAAEATYTEVIVDLRLKEGGGFKVVSQKRRALEAALNAATPFIQAQTLDITADEEELRAKTFTETMQGMVGQTDTSSDDIVRYGAYASAAQTSALRYRRAAAAVREGN